MAKKNVSKKESKTVEKVNSKKEDKNNDALNDSLTDQKKDIEASVEASNQEIVNEKTNVPEGSDLKESEREGFYDFNTIQEYDSDFDHVIENNRQKFVKLIKRDRLIRTIFILVALGLVLFSLLYVIRILENKPLGLSLIAVGAVGLIIYIVASKNITTSFSSNYLDGFYTNTDLKIFNDKEKFANLKIQTRCSKTKDDFEINGAFSNISRIVSRNEVSFNYKKQEGKVNICDLAAFSIGKDKYERPVFVGKYITLENKYNNENPIYIYLKGYKFPLPPTAIDDVSKPINTENMFVQTENNDFKNSISKEIIESLEKYTCNNVLLDATLVIKKGISYFCLGYSDEFATIPFKSKYNPGPYKQYLDDLDLFLDINSKIK